MNRLSELSPKMVDEINRMINAIASMKSIQEDVFPHIELLNKTIGSLTRLGMYDEDAEEDEAAEAEKEAETKKWLVAVRKLSPGNIAAMYKMRKEGTDDNGIARMFYLDPDTVALTLDAYKVDSP